MRKIAKIKSNVTECTVGLYSMEGSDLWSFEKTDGETFQLEVDPIEGIIQSTIFDSKGKEYPVSCEQLAWAEKWIKRFWEGGQVLGFSVRQ